MNPLVVALGIWSAPIRLEPTTPEDQLAKTEIQKEYQALSAAMRKKQKNVMAVVGSPDMEWCESGIRIKLDSLNKDFNDTLKETKSIDGFKVDIYSCKATGNEAVVTTRTEMNAVTYDIEYKKYMKMDTYYNTVDTWLKKDNRWKLRETVILNRKILLNGKDFWNMGEDGKERKNLAETGGGMK
ncbi:MAG: hypothetical protein HONBIEJF_00382 [Fimbriimonadaceae bacterium]|nr:hypothetical protein [Fimbriimonadaceae bacterium]